VKIVCVSDIHGKLSSVKKLVSEVSSVDLLLVAGDLTDFGGYSEALEIVKELEKIGSKILCVPGNCDTIEVIRALEEKNCSVHGKRVIYKDIGVAGFGGSSPTPFNTPLEFSEDEIFSKLSIVEPGDILLTHAPPKNTDLDRVFFGTHAGSISVRRIIEEKRPVLSVCGHIHEGRGVCRIKETIVVNPGPLFKKYYAVAHIDDKEVDVELKKIST